MTKNYADPFDYKRMCARCHKAHDGMSKNLRTSAAASRRQTVENARHEVIMAAFREHGSTPAAGRALGIARQTVRRHVRQAENEARDVLP